MKIAIDASQIIYGTGVSVYTQRLIENLLKIDKENEYLLFGGSLRRYKELKNKLKSLNNSQNAVYPFPPKLMDFIWNRLHIFPLEKLIGEIDVFHSSDWTQPPTKAFKVTTVHDLIPLIFPKMLHPQITEVHRRRIAWVKKEVDRIIVPSNATKLDLIKFGVNEEKIKVIYEANDFTKANQNEVDRIKKEYNLKNYLVCFSSGPYKNTENIIKAFELAKYGKDLKLVVVGRQSSGKIKPNRNVRFTGYLESNKLQALLTGSKALVFASLYEGFGQPILEGFACEVPVVTSNLSSMSEIAEDAAVLVDPTDINSISDGIEKALSAPKTYIAKGVQQLKKYSWEKMAKETLEVYKTFDMN